MPTEPVGPTPPCPGSVRHRPEPTVQDPYWPRGYTAHPRATRDLGPLPDRRPEGPFWVPKLTKSDPRNGQSGVRKVTLGAPKVVQK